jgi:hypothetical protein
MGRAVAHQGRGRREQTPVDIAVIDPFEATMLGLVTFLSVCGFGLTVWLLVHYRARTARTLAHLESTAREDQAALAGGLSATTVTLRRLVETMNRVEASITQAQEPEGGEQ